MAIDVGGLAGAIEGNVVRTTMAAIKSSVKDVLVKAQRV
jgi:hypothetical protein